MGWPWSRKSSKNSAPSHSEQQDPYNDQSELLAKVISRCEEHYRKKREEEEENELREAIEESLKLIVIDQDNTTSQSHLELYHQKTSLQESHSNLPLRDSFESISTSDLAVNHHHHPSICDGCDSVIEENGRFVNVSGVVWHPECFCCLYCYKPIKKHYVSNLRGNFHRSCYHRYCYVCGDKFARGRSLNHHEFWKEMYCPDHKTDGTPKCCSCERLEPKGTNYVMLDDERRLCVECMECAVMSTDECIALHVEIREFFETLNMRIEKEFSVFLVEKQALNKAEKKENIDNEEGVVTRGICLSEEQTVKIVCKRPRRGPNNQLIDIATEYQRLVKKCEVTAILILYGLPRLLTGAILAHEMMHAWLRLNGYRNLRAEVEEGLCQVLSHMWLESQTYSTTDAATAMASSAASSSYTTTSKKGDPSEFERKFVDFCKNQIETDESKDYGDGFREVSKLVSKFGLEKILKQIKHRGSRKF